MDTKFFAPWILSVELESNSYLHSLLSIHTQALHFVNDLFIQLTISVRVLNVEGFLASPRRLPMNHPFVCLDLGNGVPLDRISYKHVTNELFTF